MADHHLTRAFAPLRIALVSCGASKQRLPEGKLVNAEDLYTSQLFRKSLAWAKRTADLVFILSAKHGLLRLDKKIATYDVRLRYRSASVEWAKGVVIELAHVLYGRGATVSIYAGKEYVIPLVREVEAQRLRVNIDLPLGSMQIGERLAHLTKLLAAQDAAQGKAEVVPVATPTDAKGPGWGSKPCCQHEVDAAQAVLVVKAQAEELATQRKLGEALVSAANELAHEFVSRGPAPLVIGRTIGHFKPEQQLPWASEPAAPVAPDLAGEIRALLASADACLSGGDTKASAVWRLIDAAGRLADAHGLDWEHSAGLGDFTGRGYRLVKNPTPTES